MGDLQSGMSNSMMWEATGDEDGEGEFDGFTLGDGVSFRESYCGHIHNLALCG